MYEMEGPRPVPMHQHLRLLAVPCLPVLASGLVDPPPGCGFPLPFRVAEVASGAVPVSGDKEICTTPDRAAQAVSEKILRIVLSSTESLSMSTETALDPPGCPPLRPHRREI
jgi:hypothetical protein